MAIASGDERAQPARCAQVVKVLSPKAGTGGAAGSGFEPDQIWLRVFVRFAAKEAAVACAKELHGKAFDGKAVCAAFFPEAHFETLQELPCFV